MADAIFVRDKGGGVAGFRTPAEALKYASEEGGTVLEGADAAPYVRDMSAKGLGGAAAAFAGESFFSIPKALIGAVGTEDQKSFLEASEGYHPVAGFAGSFAAPWGAAGKLFGAGARGLFGLGEAADAASIFGRGASIFGEGSALEGAAARGAEGALARGGEGLADRHAMTLLDQAGAAAQPGFAGEMEGLAGRSLTNEGRAIVEAHPRSLLESAVREGTLNAGVGAINSAGDYLLSERYMDGDPGRDAEGLLGAILHGALFGGTVGVGAGVLMHGAGKVTDHLFDPAHAPKAKLPEASREKLVASFRAGGLSAEEAAAAAQSAIEHGVAGTNVDHAGYNRFSALLENSRVKRGIERGEFQIPPSMAGAEDLAGFVESVQKKAMDVRSGKALPDAFAGVMSFADDIAKAAAERRTSVLSAARDAMSPELKAVFEAHKYGGELAGAAQEARAAGARDVAQMLDSANSIMENVGHTRVGRLQALQIMAEAEAKAPMGFHLDGERKLIMAPLEHEANGEKFLSALGEHQFADKARRDVGTVAETFKAGQVPVQDSVVALEEAAQKLGVKRAGGLDAAMREHFENEAAKAIGAESKALDPTMKMLAGMAAHKLLGGGTLGYMGGKIGEALLQATHDPIGASGTIRKVIAQLRYGAEDLDRIAQGLAPRSAPKASAVNAFENMTPLGKVLWDTAPGRTARVVGQALETGFRELAPAIPARAAMGMKLAADIEKHLAEHEPKPITPVGVSPAALANLPPRYNEREVRDYQGRLTATVAPRAVIDKFLQTGVLPRDTADTLRAVHGQMVAETIAKGAALMAEAHPAERYAMGRKLETLGGPNGGLFLPSSTAGFISAVQASYQSNGPAGPAGQPGGGPGAGGSSGHASPQGPPGPGGASYAPVTVMRGMNGQFLQQTMAPPSGALSTRMGTSK